MSLGFPRVGEAMRRKGGWLILLFAAGAGAAWVVTAVMPPRFDSRMVIRPGEVHFERESKLEIRPVETPATLAALLNMEEFQLSLLKRRPDYLAKLKAREAKVSASVVRGTDMVEVVVRSSSPTLTVEIADLVWEETRARHDRSYDPPGSADGDTGGRLSPSTRVIKNPTLLMVKAELPQERAGPRPWQAASVAGLGCVLLTAFLRWVWGSGGGRERPA